MKKIAFAAMLCASASFSPVHAQVAAACPTAAQLCPSTPPSQSNDTGTVTSINQQPIVKVEINLNVPGKTGRRRIVVEQILLNKRSLIGLATGPSGPMAVVDPKLSEKLVGATCTYLPSPSLPTAECTK